VRTGLLRHRRQISASARRQRCRFKQRLRARSTQQLDSLIVERALSTTHETAFYISNRKLSAKRAATAIRSHWAIETTSHYSRDVTFNEDRSRIRKNPGVFARLRSFAFNILKANRTGTLAQDRYRAALGGLNALSEFTFI
jgi:predicted transposase YbfD/YdcC